MADPAHAFPGVVEAQFQSFARRMPAYYASVIAMMLAVVYVFLPLAPLWLSCGVPVFATVLGTWRGLWWIRHRRERPSAAEATQHLRRATRTLIVSAVLVMAMDAMLFQYGNVHTRYFILLQMLASAMCGFYCLMHLRTAALVVFTAVFVPFSVLAFSMHQTCLTVAAGTSAITAGVMISAMLGYQHDLISLVLVRAETLQLSEENLRLAHLDMVTGLPNRRRFFEILDAMQDQGRHAGSQLAIGILDLDGFKPVNDTYGHLVGDRVLAEIATRLLSVSGTVEHLCRLGGDEFAFSVKTRDPNALADLGTALIESVRRALYLDNRTITVGCSIGFAVCPPSSDFNGLLLFEQADYALYHAKRTGRARAVLFSDEHETLLRKEGSIEQSLRSADLRSEFFPLFQPIVDLRQKRVTAFECLARWNSPVLGAVSPAAFIPIAERTGLISELTTILLQKALEAAAAWPQEVGLSFNVSPYDIASRDKVAEIIEIIQDSGISSRRIAIELTETALLHSFEETIEHMAMLRAIGVSISLDDFGTGHSSLSYLHALPLDKIKVDRSFVRDLQSNPATRNVVRSVLTLCRDLGLDSIIEGVEVQSQLDILERLGGTLIQGYFYAKPMPIQEIDGFLSNFAEPSISEPIWAPYARA